MSTDFDPGYPDNNPTEIDLDWHHIFPQNEAMSDWFADRDINVHEWTVAIDPVDHDAIHYLMNWNQEWQVFMDENPDATRADVENKVAEMMEGAGILDEWMHWYRDPDRP